MTFWIIGPIIHINEIYKTKSQGDKWEQVCFGVIK